MGGGGGLGKIIGKVVKNVPVVGKTAGGILDQYLGTDTLGNKAAAERDAAAARDANQRKLTQQNNANILDVNSQAENIVQTDAGGSAAALDAAGTSVKKRRAGSISTSLGL